MGLGDLFKAVVNTATLPIDVLKDVTDTALGEKVYRAERPLSRVSEKIEEIADNLNDVTKN